MDRSEKTIILIVIGVLVSCLCLAAICGVSILLITNFSTSLTADTQATSSPTPTATPFPATPRPQIIKSSSAAQESLAILESEEIPTADLIELAEKFEGKQNIPLQLSIPPTEYEIGDTLDFYKLNVDSNEMTKTTAVLRYKTNIIYFWAEPGINLDQQKLKQVVDIFANGIYPTNHEFFGTEWIPGVDNDPHLYILFARNLGSSLAGYHSPSDSVLIQAHEYSNMHEMFTVNADVQTLDDPYTLSVMAHEFQHLIHGYHDPNEESWLNEGFSELATLLNGYDAGGFDFVYMNNPDLQLNDWSEDPNINDAHYGASFLYTTYLLDRFGEDITKRVVADELNGFASIDHVFQDNGLVDQQTGKQITADDFFTDWAITNYFLDPQLGDGRYTYSNYSGATVASTTDSIIDCDKTGLSAEVKQYGVDYYEVYCPNREIHLTFEGAPIVNVLPDVTDEGKFMWSNRADTSAMSLSQEFDLTGVSGPVTLTYQTWYDIETDYDYLYLLASENGQDWEVLTTPSCTMLDINGNSYGCAYNGQSGRWLSESVDLTKFAGKKVTLNFEYVTDAAVTAEGFILDNIAIPEIGYETDFEADDGGWTRQGFVRISNSIPQTFLVSVVSTGENGIVKKFDIQSGDVLNLTLDPLPSFSSYIVVISGSTRYTRQDAQYQIKLGK